MKINGVLLKSNNGIQAESDGRITFSKITKSWFKYQLDYCDDFTKDDIKIIYDKLKTINVKTLKEIAKKTHNGEWHHVSKFANKINYYNYLDIANYILINDNFDLAITNLLNENLKYAGEYGIIVEKGKGKYKTYKTNWQKFENATKKGN